MQETNKIGKDAHPVFHYTVDGEKQETVEHELTADTILKNAGLDPTQYYLKEIQGNHQISYQGRGNSIIHMHEKMEFITVFLGSTPVS